jgi:ABC-type sugar transport system ATPase subunit
MAQPDTVVAAIAARGIRKSFGGVVALSDIDLVVAPGECHAVVGENGAGKSTLMKVLSGLLAPDSGTVSCFGSDIAPTPKAAREAGIALVHQERSLVPDLTVAENISLGNTPTSGGFVKFREQSALATRLLDRVGISVSSSTLLGKLSSAQQQMVEIAKALCQEPKVLILDEPSASLTPMETERLITMLKGLAAEGIAIVYISHRLPEIYALCQAATVLRDGQCVGRFDLATHPSEELVQLMVGRKLEHDLKVHRRTHTGEVLLDVSNLESSVVHDVSFQVNAGEIVGLGGLVGAGRSEIVRTVLGLDPRFEGTVTITDASGAKRAVNTYKTALNCGVSYLPEERRTEGVLIDMPIETNLVLPTRGATSWWGFSNGKARRALSEQVIDQLDVHPTERRRLVSSLSGGNQQKIAFGKWLPSNPRVFIMDEPTRGVDVGAKAEIHNLVRMLADQGVAVLFVSSDLPELLSLADRILVVRDGRIVRELTGNEATDTTVMAAAVGHDEKVGSNV